MKQTAKRRTRNVTIKRDIKGAVKAFFAKPSAETLSAAQSELDTAVKKNLMKKNTVSRRKAQLSKVAKDAGVKLATGEKKAKKTAAPEAKTPVEKKVAAKKTTGPADKPVVKKAVAKKPVKKTTK